MWAQFEAVRVTATKTEVLWNAMLCRKARSSQRFGGFGALFFRVAYCWAYRCMDFDPSGFQELLLRRQSIMSLSPGVIEDVFLRSGNRAPWQILTIKPTRCNNFSNLFCNETLHISDSSSVHHQEFFTVNTAIDTGLLTACEQVQDPARKLILPASCQHIYHCYAYSEKLSNDGQRNCPKHVEFYSKNKFEKLLHLHLVYFIVRIIQRRSGLSRAQPKFVNVLSIELPK